MDHQVDSRISSELESFCTYFDSTYTSQNPKNILQPRMVTVLLIGLVMQQKVELGINVKEQMWCRPLLNLQ